MLEIGQTVEPYGKLGGIHFSHGERYYMFVQSDGSVSLIPADILDYVKSPQPAKEDKSLR